MLDESDEQSKSKTLRKKEMHDIQKIGEKLLTLTDPQLLQLSLPEKLTDAIADAKRFKSHEAKRRQLQYIGKLMRDIEVIPLLNALEKLKPKPFIPKKPPPPT